jgi:hypothetical protein
MTAASWPLQNFSLTRSGISLPIADRGDRTAREQQVQARRLKPPEFS